MVENSINIPALTEYLEANLPWFHGPLTLEKFAGGQSNPTYKVITQSGTYVLRSQPLGKLLKSAHAVDREYQVLTALANSQVPVAQVYHLCTDTQVIGAMFYLMEFCNGKVYWDAALPEADSNATRAAMYDAMNSTLVALHSVNLKQSGLTDYGKPGSYFQRQLARWTKQYKATELEPIPAVHELMQWLAVNLPEDDGRECLVHGDFRLDNMMFAQNEPKIIAVLDWELSTLGHPFADLAYQCMQLRMPQGVGDIRGLQGIDRTQLGIPTEEEYVALYCQRMGIEKIENWSFYLAFSFFRLAAIAQGVAKRAIEGNASNKNASKVAGYVEPLAQMALEIIQAE